MKNYQKKIIFLTLFGLLLSINSVHSQSIKEIEIYNWFDNSIGKNNLDINNGILHTNPYTTLDGSTIYFRDDKFEKGTLKFEGQFYYATSLKYDIYRDILILNPFGASELIGISLVKEKVDSFSLYDRNFVKLNKEQYNLPGFSTGYYEVTESTPDFTFYIKHSKTIQKVVREDGIFYQFKPKNNYFLAYKKSQYTVDSKSDIIKIFPEKKKNINEFYDMNRELRKSDLNLFMKNLMKYINNSLLTEK
ncbi:hypothetical protein [Flavobacterium fluviale]|uniref:DKNYY family protein n=1 Tax=Flavobacterium fluviale TaxID=2249356 RepID=A0A344LQV7_9FLAO|nr:hypothetical protein [Flavobacterium fluviale]AXB56299.1 hypothetical protein HYN86_06675 [Flavobacterium fluviale]